MVEAGLGPKENHNCARCLFVKKAERAEISRILSSGGGQLILHSTQDSARKQGSKEAGPVKFRGFPSCDGEGERKGKRKERHCNDDTEEGEGTENMSHF